MIIQCVICTKKFEVDSSLVPDNGRTIQCGACNQIWFYKPAVETATQILSKKDISQQTYKIKIKEEENQQNIQKKEVLVSKKTLNETKDIPDPVKNNETSTKLNLIKILFYLIVGIISFAGVVIFLDTFKSPLSKILPNLESLLYNLYESIKDISLFIKDLFV